MRFGIDCRNFYDVQNNSGAGIERYVYHLVRNILRLHRADDFVLFFRPDISSLTIKKVKEDHSRVKIVKVGQPNKKIPFWDNHVHFSRILKKEKLDVVLFPANVVPFFYRQKSIVVIHDLAIYSHPEWFPEKQSFAKNFLVPNSLKKATAIITVSNNTKNDIIKIFGLDGKKIKVIYPGVTIKDNYTDMDFLATKRKFSLKEEFILFLGTIEPRKNIMGLLEEFIGFCEENKNQKIQLVLAGSQGWIYQSIMDKIRNINANKEKKLIHYLGRIGNRERNILLKNCRLFIYPSFYEGFGFPVVEAMALGAPVICSNNSSLGEIADGHSLTIDVFQKGEIKKAIEELVLNNSLREKYRQQGFLRARDFSWKSSANKVLQMMIDIGKKK